MDTKPIVKGEGWREILIGDIRLGFLSMNESGFTAGNNAVPVLEFPDTQISDQIGRAKQLGARAVLEGPDDPDYPSIAAVLVDPFGNEFELTSFHG